MIHKNFYSLEDLKSHIKSGIPTLYHSSQTSTVIPFEKIEKELSEKTVLGNLSTIKGNLSLLENGNLLVEGFVTWKEAKEFCRSKNREIMTSPTEELAGILSGIATSATGERSFGFKNLRSQVVSVTYLDFNGDEKKLSADKRLNFSDLDLSHYNKRFEHYRDYKNAPFPRLEFETDLMTGTEGQLGVMTSAIIKTIPYEEETYLFILLSKWEIDYSPHLELFNAVQNYRGKIRACELLDANSLSYLPKEKNPGNDEDVVFLEIKKIDFEEVFENIISNLKLISHDKIFEIAPSRCRDMRMSVPRAIFEVNSKMGVTKKGTDVQVCGENFSKLLDFYRGFSKLGVDYNLFGHFGDAHLHFNFMPDKSKDEFCNLKLQELYQAVYQWQDSPFAEHGIGLLKKKFIFNFYSDEEKKVFRYLKNKMDPHSQFFIEGFMSC